MSSPRIISFRIEPDRVAELDAIAKSLDRDRSHLLNEAVESYLEPAAPLCCHGQGGTARVKEGENIDDEDLDELIGSWVKAKEPRKKEEKARQDK